MMNLSSFFANKIFEYLLAGDDPAQKRQARRTTPLPPPWAAADAFRSLCDSCGACAKACGSGIISMDEEGFPVVDFSRGTCTFCGDCARSCPTGALQFEADKTPWNVRARIESSCLLGSRVLCRSCGDGCGPGAISFPLAEGQLPTVAADRCSGCGACAAVCPVGAVSFST
jgi:ferredoxin-type protein NapF